MTYEIPAWRRWASLAVLVGAVLIIAIDGTVLYLAVPKITEALSPTAEQILWIGDIYSLVLAGLLVTMGNLADRIGRRRLLLIGSVAFGVASVIAAFAPSAEMLIAARFILGIAGATIMPSTLSLIRNIFSDPKERTQAIALWAAASASGIALGPLVGGALLEHFWWGSVFLVVVPVVVLVFIFGLLLLPESRDDNPGPFDFVSSALSIVTVASFVYAIKTIAADGLSLKFLVLLLLAGVGGFMFIRRQRRLAIPMIDVELFKIPAFSGAVFANFISVFALTGALFFFSQYLQLVRGLSPLQAGLAELPTAISAALAAVVVGFLLRLVGRGKAIGVGLALAALGLVLIGVFEDQDRLWLLLSALVPMGLGVGIAETLSTDAITSSVRPEKAGAASSVAETAYELGVAFGIAVLGSAVTAIYRRTLELPAGVPADVSAAIEDSLASAMSILPEGHALIELVHHAFVDGMQTATFIAAGLVLLAAIVASLVIPQDKGNIKVEH